METETETMSQTRSHEHRVTLPVPTDRVWQAITDPAELTNWFPLEAAAMPGEGGSLTYRWGAFEGTCEIQIWRPSAHLRTSWIEGPGADSGRRPLAVDWFLESDREGTILRLVHSGFGTDADFDDEFDGTRRGWRYELGSLRHYLTRHEGKRRRSFWVTRPTDLSPEQTWERFGSAGGPLARADSLAQLRAGQAFATTFAGTPIEGVVILNNLPREFAGVVRNFDDGMIRLGHESCAGSMAHVWFSGWGVDQARIDELERTWSSAMERAFA